MKKITLAIIAFIALLSCNQAEVNTNKDSKISKETITEEAPQKEAAETELKQITFDFEKYELNKLPSLWSQAFTGKGDATEWKIIDDNGNKVMAQLSSDNPNYHFNVVVFDEIVTKNVNLKVKLKGVNGNMDQGGGFVWRYTDKDNYYVVRANPLEDNVVLYKVVNGRRTDLPVLGKGRTYGVDVSTLGNDWFSLSLTVIDDLFTVYFNGMEIFQVKDQSINTAGKIGLWTKADAVTYFDDFVVE